MGLRYLFASMRARWNVSVARSFNFLCADNVLNELESLGFDALYSISLLFSLSSLLFICLSCGRFIVNVNWFSILWVSHAIRCLKIHQTFGDATGFWVSAHEWSTMRAFKPFKFCANAMVSFVISLGLFHAGCSKSVMSSTIKNHLFLFLRWVLSSSLVATVPYRQHATMRAHSMYVNVCYAFVHTMWATMGIREKKREKTTTVTKNFRALLTEQEKKEKKCRGARNEIVKHEQFFDLRTSFAVRAAHALHCKMIVWTMIRF